MGPTQSVPRTVLMSGHVTGAEMDLGGQVQLGGVEEETQEEPPSPARSTTPSGSDSSQGEYPTAMLPDHFFSVVLTVVPIRSRPFEQAGHRRLRSGADQYPEGVEEGPAPHRRKLRQGQGRCRISLCHVRGAAAARTQRPAEVHASGQNNRDAALHGVRILRHVIWEIRSVL